MLTCERSKVRAPVEFLIACRCHVNDLSQFTTTTAWPTLPVKRAAPLLIMCCTGSRMSPLRVVRRWTPASGPESFTGLTNCLSRTMVSIAVRFEPANRTLFSWLLFTHEVTFYSRCLHVVLRSCNRPRYCFLLHTRRRSLHSSSIRG